MLILIRGAGDIASGIAIRLYRSGFDVIMTDTARPTAIRRTVSFSGAIVAGSQTVEDVTARLANTPEDALNITKQGDIAVLADEKCDCLRTLSPNALVDAILAKRNLGTRIDMAPAVIGCLLYTSPSCPTRLFPASSAATRASACFAPRRTGCSGRSWT